MAEQQLYLEFAAREGMAQGSWSWRPVRCSGPQRETNQSGRKRTVAERSQKEMGEVRAWNVERNGRCLFFSNFFSTTVKKRQVTGRRRTWRVEMLTSSMRAWDWSRLQTFCPKRGNGFLYDFACQAICADLLLSVPSGFDSNLNWSFYQRVQYLMSSCVKMKWIEGICESVSISVCCRMP